MCEVEDRLHDECGVFACVSKGKRPTELDVANVISLGLVGLQHRGQESAGIVTCGDSDLFKVHKGMGLVSNVFNPHVLSQLNGNSGIGHTRYSTHGASSIANCQPFVVDTQHGYIAVAHNGELVNKRKLRKQILNRGVGLSTGSDSELITQLLCLPLDSGEENQPNWTERLTKLMTRTPAAYSLVMLHNDVVYAARDPYGNRPLCVGRLVSQLHSNQVEDDSIVEGWVVSSESCVFQSMGAELIREVKPGEIIRLNRHGVTSMGTIKREESRKPAFCVFEYVYFSRPDSIYEGQMVYSVRKRCGIQLAKEAPVSADVISTVPESATPSAFGFAQESGIPYDEVLAKNRYIGRTFIQPSTRLRKLAVAKKFGVLVENVRGKRIVVVDDSIVRGNTMSSIVRMLRDNGAKEVHVRIASPPVRNPCYMGINIPTRTELLANQMSLDETREFLDVDSLAYLSVEGLLKSVRPESNVNPDKEKNVNLSLNRLKIVESEEPTRKDEAGHCVACLTGNYPVPLDW
uniref:Amidophosphoribosyltransferase n=1 Tax=Phallusia mammillata TaxID=59560 RepID=A0A6F9DNP5_9ASCI|nr:amidophosphoribosyltransferase-like [Phallusia mammillata]